MFHHHINITPSLFVCGQHTVNLTYPGAVLVLNLLHVTIDNCLRDCALMSHGYQDRYLPYCKDSCVQALQKNSWCGEKIPPQVPAKCSEGSKAGRTCCFQDMREMYREEKNGDIQTLQRTGVTSVCAGEKKKEKKSDKNTSQLLCRTFQTLSCRLRLPHLPEGSASQKFVQGICIHILHRTKRKKKKQAVSRKFLPVLDIQLCRTATLLKQSGCLNLLIRFTHGLHDTGAGTGCFH